MTLTKGSQYEDAGLLNALKAIICEVDKEQGKVFPSHFVLLFHLMFRQQNHIFQIFMKFYIAYSVSLAIV